MRLTTEQATALVKDGKVALDNGQTLRLRIEPDDTTTINDYDCYGKVSLIYRGDSDRPAGFDGMAEKLWGYHEQYWWQPPDDLRKEWHTYEHKTHLRKVVHEILSFGFECYWLELCAGTDAYGKPVIVDYVVTGGYEPMMSDTDKVDVVMDLAQWDWLSERSVSA